MLQSLVTRSVYITIVTTVLLGLGSGKHIAVHDVAVTTILHFHPTMRMGTSERKLNDYA